MKYLITILASTLSLSTNFALADESWQSPYFIDGIHCLGLESLYDAQNQINLYESDEIGAIATKSIRQQQCESIFRSFGIEKFSWVSPEDLEKTSIALKMTRKFKSVDLKIEKSDTKNHVHLIGTFVPYEPEFTAGISLKAERNKGSHQSDDRTTRDMEARLGFMKRGPKNRPAYEVTLHHWQSNANPLDDKDLMGSDNKPFDFNDHEKIMLKRPSGELNEIYFRMNTLDQNPGRYNFFGNFGLIRSKLTGDEESVQGSMVELGVDGILDAMQSNWNYSLSIMNESYTLFPWDYESTEGTPVSRKNMFFIGLSENLKSRIFDLDIKAYRSLTKDMHAFYTLHGLYKIGEYLSIQHGLGFDYDGVNGAILPQHRFGFPNRNISRIYYQGSSSFISSPLPQTINLKVGMQLIDVGDNRENGYNQGSSFAEIGWKTNYKNFDVDLSFLYGERRIY